MVTPFGSKMFQTWIRVEQQFKIPVWEEPRGRKQLAHNGIIKTFTGQLGLLMHPMELAGPPSGASKLCQFLVQEIGQLITTTLQIDGRTPTTPITLNVTKTLLVPR